MTHIEGFLVYRLPFWPRLNMWYIKYTLLVEDFLVYINNYVKGELTMYLTHTSDRTTLVENIQKKNRACAHVLFRISLN